MESSPYPSLVAPKFSRMCLAAGPGIAACVFPGYVLAAEVMTAINNTLADMWVGLMSLACFGGIAAAVVALLLLHRKTRQHWRSEERLRDLLAFQMGVLDAIPQPITLRDTNLALVACNSAFEKLMMDTRQNLVSSSLARAVTRVGGSFDFKSIEDDYRQVIASEQPLSKDRDLVTDGREITVEHWIEPLRNARGVVVGVVSGWMDVTQRQRVLKELACARDRAESANRTKSTFLASVSHEIRTPMNAIMGMLELTLSHPKLAAEDVLQLTTALHASKSLLALIDDLLDLSKMEAGKFLLQPRPTNLYELVEEVVSVFHPVAAGKGLDLALVVCVPDAAPVAHNVDPLRLKQVMNNFVSNAIRFTSRGSVTVRMEAEPPADGHQWISLSVSDTGVGIPANALDTLLQPFVQVEQTRPASDRGTGLGLSICDRLVKKMGGKINIESTLGVGTTISARLSLPVVAALPAQAQTAASDTVEQTAIGSLQVLVVDDQASNVLLLQRQLQKLGHQVICAGNGQEALALVDTASVDLIVCDCAMPVMDGYTFAQTLRARADATGRLPILGYTAGAHEAEIERARIAGMNEILIKPVDLGTLRQAIASVLHIHRASSECDVTIIS